MKLGLISPSHDREGLMKVASYGLRFTEFDINGDDLSYLNETEIKKALSEFNVSLAAIGRWGRNRLNSNGTINHKEFDDETKLIDLCAATECPVYITGINYLNDKSLYENYTLAIDYFTKLIDYAQLKNVKLCTYNCNWNNWVYMREQWEVIHKHIPELGIKFDPSHSVNGLRDYLQETKNYGQLFDHVHIKGTININGERVDDPPAGMDSINWPVFLSLLRKHEYKGVLSIEPHSEIWQGELGEKGIRFTIDYIKRLLFIN